MEEKDMKCTTRSSEYIIRRPWLTARKDIVVHPDGRVQPEYYVLEYPDFINVIAITTDGRVIMEQQWRQAVGEVSLEIPAGVVEKGESPLQAAKREARRRDGIHRRHMGATARHHTQQQYGDEPLLYLRGTRRGADDYATPRRHRGSPLFLCHGRRGSSPCSRTVGSIRQ